MSETLPPRLGDFVAPEGAIWIYRYKSEAQRVSTLLRKDGDRTTVKPITIRAAGVTVKHHAVVIHWS